MRFYGLRDSSLDNFRSVVKTIWNNPGITMSELSEQLGISSTRLREFIKIARINGYVVLVPYRDEGRTNYTYYRYWQGLKVTIDF